MLRRQAGSGRADEDKIFSCSGWGPLEQVLISVEPEIEGASVSDRHQDFGTYE